MIYSKYSIIITNMQQEEAENLKLFGEIVRKIRMEKSPSLNRLAFSRGGVTSATLSRIENGLVDFKFSTLIKLSKTLDVPINDLFKYYVYKSTSDD